jgi:hypothetical protein
MSAAAHDGYSLQGFHLPTILTGLSALAHLSMTNASIAVALPLRR